MKNLKLALFSLAFSLLLITSCTNDNEPVEQDQQQTEESESITNALTQLRTQFNANGNVTQTNNPAGNIVLDFCFDFVYPLTLSYNNGTTVTVNDLDGIISILIASTNELYINGIAFPFNVEVFNEETNSIDVVTINDENQFVNLIEDCDFNDTETCDCFEVYEPVCVEITDPSGQVFTITYSNSCYAACDGFTEDNFVDTCENDYSNGNECYTINYPISIIVNNNTTITINSEEEFGNATYDIYNFDFVYPFDITLQDGNVVTINSNEDIETILDDCYNNNPNDCDDCQNQPIDPVCVEIENPSGGTETYVYDNACYAFCDGYTEADFVYCNSGNDVCLPSAISDALTGNTGWSVSSYNNSSDLDSYEITFSTDGTLEWMDGGASFNGTWSASDNPVNGHTLSLSFSGPNLQQATGDWMIVDCDLPCSISLLSNGGDEMIISRNCD